MQGTERFDDFLFTIVKETGGLEGLLHSMFSFLMRRTDFFYESDPGDKMGFPPGYAQRMLLGIMDSYQQQHYKKHPKKDPKEYNEKVKKYQAQQQKANEGKPQEEKKAEVEHKPKFISTDLPLETVHKQQEIPKQETKKEDEGWVDQKKADPKSNAISTYNGASTSKYNWSQGVNEVTLQIPIAEGTRAKQLQVDITSTHLKIVNKTNQEIICEGDFYDKVKADDSTWSIDGPSIILNLEKASENIWKAVLKGDEEIDATKVDNSKPIDQFDTETQAALRKIMYEQQRKMAGLPTSEEESQLEMMKKAWNAEGSPFKGQPFDPSKFNLPGSNSFNINTES